MKKKVLFLTISLFIFLIINSCKRDEEAKQNDIESINLTTNKNEYAPYEIITITSEQSIFPDSTIKAKINNVEVELLADGNNAAFLLPEFANGTYELTFSLADKNYSVPIKIAVLTNVLTPNEYFTEINVNINAKISELNGYISQLQLNGGDATQIQALKNDVVLFQNNMNNFSSQYNTLSAGDKLIFAKTIAANKPLIDEYNALISSFNESTSVLKGIQSVDNFESQVEVAMGKFVASKILTISLIPKIILCVSVGSFINPVAGMGLAIVFIASAITTANDAEDLVNKSLKPFEFITESGESIFQTGMEKPEKVSVKYRSLIDSDSGNSTVNTIVVNFKELREKINNNLINKLPTVLKPSYRMSSLKNSFTSTAKSVYNQYINFTNVNNPNVTLQKIPQTDGSLKLKATTNATTDQAFTYDVEYTNTNFASNLKKTVTTKVKVGGISLEGNWKLTDIENEDVPADEWEIDNSTGCPGQKEDFFYSGTANITNTTIKVNISEKYRYFRYDAQCNVVEYKEPTGWQIITANHNNKIESNTLKLNDGSGTNDDSINWNFSNGLIRIIDSNKINLTYSYHDGFELVEMSYIFIRQ